MGWLVVIWAFAALCGWAVHAAYEPAIETAVALMATVDPGLAAQLADLATLPGLSVTAGIATAIVVGGVLTLIWLVARLISRGSRRVGVRRDAAVDQSEAGSPADWQIGAPEDREPARPSPGPREARDVGTTQRWGRGT